METATLSATPPTEFTGHPRRWLILGILCLCLVLVVASISSLNVAIPSIQRALDASQSQLQWIIDAYALVFAGLLMPMGALGDRFGRKWTLLTGLALYGSAAVLASRSTDAHQVIAARAIMGIAAALIMPSTLSLLTSVFPARERPKAIAVWAAFAGAGGAFGVVSSGLLLRWFWWGSVFFVTVPIVVIALVLIIPFVPNSSDSDRRPLDPLGSGLSMLGLFALIYALIEGPVRGWLNGLVVGGFLAAVVLLSLFVMWELRARFPMLDPRLFRIPRFAVATATITNLFFLMFAMFFVLTQYLQFVKNYTPLAAGVAVLPSPVTMLLVAPRGPAIAARISVRRTIALGQLFIAAGASGLFFIRPGTPYVFIGMMLAVISCGSGLVMPSATSSIMTSLPMNKAGVGSAVNDTTREVGGAIGIAAIGSIVASIYRHSLGSSLDVLPAATRQEARDNAGSAIAIVKSSAPPGQVESVLDSVHSAFTKGMNVGMLVAAVSALLGAAITARWYPHDTDLGRGHH
jgi:DHA2 family multidrug resistance protein-like MFS transporter